MSIKKVCVYITKIRKFQQIGDYVFHGPVKKIKWFQRIALNVN